MKMVTKGQMVWQTKISYSKSCEELLSLEEEFKETDLPLTDFYTKSYETKRQELLSK